MRVTAAQVITGLAIVIVPLVPGVVPVPGDRLDVVIGVLVEVLPRLPLVESPKDFWAFSKAGRLLADLHLHYDDFSKSLPAEGGGVPSESGSVRLIGRIQMLR